MVEVGADVNAPSADLYSHDALEHEGDDRGKRYAEIAAYLRERSAKDA